MTTNDTPAPYATTPSPAPVEAGAVGVGQLEANSISLLVTEFAKALNQKMQAAAIKYGYQADQWLDPTWRTDCIEDLLLHIDKGDPRDVAAYCAFAWYHGWSLTPATTLAQMADQRNEFRADATQLRQQLADQEHRLRNEFQVILSQNEAPLLEALAEARGRVERAEARVKERDTEVLDILRDMRLPRLPLPPAEDEYGEDNHDWHFVAGQNKERKAINDYYRQKAYEYDPQGIGPDPVKDGEWDTLPAAGTPGRAGEGKEGSDRGFFLNGDPAINPFGPR